MENIRENAAYIIDMVLDMVLENNSEIDLTNKKGNTLIDDKSEIMRIKNNMSAFEKELAKEIIRLDDLK